MTRHLSVATAIEKNKIASDVAFVLLLKIDIKDQLGAYVETLHLAKNTEEVVFQGQLYQPANFDVEMKLDVEEQPSFSANAEDPTGFIRERMEAYGGGVGSDCTVMVVNTGNLAQPPEVKETFEIVGASMQGYKVSFQLGVDNPLATRFPKRLMYRDQCTLIFKGIECKYAGPDASCTYVWNDCKVKGNQINFGGFRGLQTLFR
jgi:phage-related protein